MTACLDALYDDGSDRRRRSALSRALVPSALGFGAITLAALGGTAIMRPAQEIKVVVEKAAGVQPKATLPSSQAQGSGPFGQLVFAPPTLSSPEQAGTPLGSAFQAAMPRLTAALENQTRTTGAPEPFGPPLPPELQAAQDAPGEFADISVPMPAPRPPGLGFPEKDKRLATARPAPGPAPASSAPTDGRGLLERLFGFGQQPSGPVLAYANPQDGLGRAPSLVPDRSAPSDATTAVYDISARTVYMPDGSKLEAHSGLGEMMDKPEHVHVRMRGATPPAVYDLTLREKLFHGVQAIRLTPVNSSVFGRTGLLAHTYMLGPNGDSNGCVSFRNYDAFLQAFLKGNVRRLVVVARR